MADRYNKFDCFSVKWPLSGRILEEYGCLAFLPPTGYFPRPTILPLHDVPLSACFACKLLLSSPPTTHVRRGEQMNVDLPQTLALGMADQVPSRRLLTEFISLFPPQFPCIILHTLTDLVLCSRSPFVM